MPAAPVARPLRQPGEDADHGDVARHHVHHRRLHLARLAALHTDQAHQARVRLDDAVHAGTVRVGAFLPVGRDRAVDQRGVLLCEIGVAQPQPRHHAGPHALHHDIGGSHQPARHVETLGPLEIDRHAELVAVEPVEQRAVRADPARAKPAPHFAARRLHLDHAGPHVGHQHGGRRAGADLREIDDGQSFQSLAEHGHASRFARDRLKVPCAVAMRSPAAVSSSADEK
ncbi:hypothetical protein D3C72_877410 [compost metagenome]